MSAMKHDRSAETIDESVHKLFFESNPLPIWIHDAHSLRFIGVNDAALKKYGYTREEFMAMTVEDISPMRRLERIDTGRRVPAESSGVWHHRLKTGEVIAVETTSHELDYGGRKAVFTVVHEMNPHAKYRPGISEKSSEDMFEELPVGYYRTSTDGSFLRVNNAFAEMLGYSRAEIVGREVPPELAAAADSSEKRFNLEFPAKPGLIRLRARSGKHVVIEDYPRFVTDTGGRIIYREGICRDVTVNESAPAINTGNTDLYGTIVDNIPLPILVHSEWQFVHANLAAARLIGAESVDSIMGKSLLDFIHPESIALALDHVNAVSSGINRSESVELKYVRFDGSTIVVELTSARMIFHGRPAIQSALRDVTSSQGIEGGMRLQGAALGAVSNAVVITDVKGRVEWVNPAFENLSGYGVQQSVGMPIGDLVRSGMQDETYYRNLWNTIVAGKVWRGQIVNRRKDGTLYNEWMTITPFWSESGRITHFIAVKEDITERKSLEDELTQAQKMDAIGRLAGGVAHDYNNILGVILGYGELIRSKLKEEETIRRQLDAIIGAAKRGADLTRQLLSFARRESVSPRVLSLNSSVESIRDMLQQLIGENRTLIFKPGTDLWNVKADPTQIDQVIVNLVTNARDAIEDVGTITIETGNVHAGADFVRFREEMNPGDYVRISISDTGKGMDKRMVKEIFEPFYTTKPKGHGTGLGLSMVYGIVKQNGGVVEVYSEKAIGTTFDVYLPRSNGNAEHDAEASADEMPNGNATVLVVEDQADLLESAKKGLEEYGYKVLTAQSPSEALALSDSFKGAIELLLVDVIMPTMNGGELSQRIRTTRPRTKALFMSGYSAEVLDPTRALGKKVEFIQKPFTPKSLAMKIRQVLEK